jgi:hypothetical protein
MSGFASDLVRDSRLDVTFDSGATCHIVSSRVNGRRQKTQERWERKRQLGSGTFGVVWLESCATSRRKGQLRAVKEIAKHDLGHNPIDYGRELEAMAKFSGDKVLQLCF